MRKLLGQQPIFVGFKLDTSLRRQVEGLSGPDRKYIAADESAFLRLCLLDEHVYVGKLVEDRLTTDRVDDVRRNVLSIMQRLFPDTRMPQQLQMIVCGDGEGEPAPLRRYGEEQGHRSHAACRGGRDRPAPYLSPQIPLLQAVKGYVQQPGEDL